MKVRTTITITIDRELDADATQSGLKNATDSDLKGLYRYLFFEGNEDIQNIPTKLEYVWDVCVETDCTVEIIREENNDS